MYSKRTLLVIAAVLLAEAVAIVIAPSRLPVAGRVLAAGLNAIAIAVLLLLVRQRSS